MHNASESFVSLAESVDWSKQSARTIRGSLDLALMLNLNKLAVRLARGDHAFFPTIRISGRPSECSGNRAFGVPSQTLTENWMIPENGYANMQVSTEENGWRFRPGI